ncbi:MAG: EAL domain-containing protein [Endozoicomonadaceae bacterium]|nr:EAL domain-containing protein [Endozoicomonadaceae bacterium]
MQSTSLQAATDQKNKIDTIEKIQILLDANKLSVVRYQDNTIVYINDLALLLFETDDSNEFINAACELVFSDDACFQLDQAIKNTSKSKLILIDRLVLSNHRILSAWVMPMMYQGSPCIQVAWDPNSIPVSPKKADIMKTTVNDSHVALVVNALKQDRLKLFFQPIACLTGGIDSHYDVFIRLYTAEGHEIFAGEFMRDLSQHAVAIKIDRWVILQAIKKLLIYNNSEKKAKLLIYLSEATINDSEFISWLSVILEKSKLEPDALVFQVEMNYITKMRDQIITLCQQLVNKGCLISIYHFELMNPVASFLRNIPCCYIKLHNQFTQELIENKHNEQEIKAMISDLHHLNIKAIVPYVESPNIMAQLWRYGVDYVQGYFLQKPKDEMSYDFSSDC